MKIQTDKKPTKRNLITIIIIFASLSFLNTCFACLTVSQVSEFLSRINFILSATTCVIISFVDTALILILVVIVGMISEHNSCVHGYTQARTSLHMGICIVFTMASAVLGMISATTILKYNQAIGLQRGATLFCLITNVGIVLISRHILKEVSSHDDSTSSES